MAFNEVEYLVAPSLYDISVGAAADIDLRSGVQRAIDFVGRAHHIGALNRGLLVVGTGIVGVVTACAARELGCEVLLAGSEKYGRIATSARWVDPRVYAEWPPASSTAVPWLGVPWQPRSHAPGLQALCQAVGWKGGPARAVVTSWRLALDEMLDGVREIPGWVFGCRRDFLRPPDPPPAGKAGWLSRTPGGLTCRKSGGWDLTLSDGSSGGRWGTVVVCRGPHVERDTLSKGVFPPHRSFAYWDPTDPLWRTPATVPPGGEIIVVGAGDGGQQDLFRLLTGHDPVEFLTKVSAKEATLFRRFAHEAQNAVSPAAPWGAHRTTLRGFLSANGNHWTDVVVGWIQRYAPIIEQIGRRTFVYDTRNLDQIECFALNQILTLALGASLGRNDLVIGGVPRKDIAEMTPTNHPSAADCVDVDHRLKFGTMDHVNVRRFILRIGTEKSWLFGEPRHARLPTS